MWIVPSVLGRARLKRLAETAEETGMTAEAVCLADIRDPLGGAGLPANWTVVPALGPLSPTETVRIASAVRRGGGPIGILPADHLPRSRGWDRRLEDAAGDWRIAHCNDLLFGGREPRTGVARVTGAVCIGARLASVMGRVVPDGMSLADARVAWASFALRLGRLVYLPEVVVERPRTGGDIPRTRPEGRAALFRWLNDEARPLIARVREAMARDAVAADVMAEALAGSDARRAV